MYVTALIITLNRRKKDVGASTAREREITASWCIVIDGPSKRINVQVSMYAISFRFSPGSKQRIFLKH